MFIVFRSSLFYANDCEGGSMSADVLVVMDFYDADQTQRNAFAAQVERSRWQHHPVLANAYYTSWPEQADDEDVVRESEIDMKNAATLAGIDRWDATCILGEPGWLPEMACCA